MSRKNAKTQDIDPELDISDLPEDLPDLDVDIDAKDAFSVEIVKGPVKQTFSQSYRERAARINTIDALKEKRALNCLQRLPGKSEYVHMIVGHEFAGFNLIPSMLRLSGATQFGKVYLTTLGFSRDNLSQLAVMMDEGKLIPGKVKILCGDFFRRADSDLWDIGRLLARERGFGFRSIRNHTKLILAELGGCHYVIESSANLRSCANIESFTMTQSKPLFDFHAGWINTVWLDAQV